VIFLAVLLQRLGRAQIASIGGDAIGRRPIDYHLAGLRRLGAEIERSDGITRVQCTALRGSSVRLDFPSVGATEQVLVAAAGAMGRTVLRNAAIEPEIGNLVGLLRAMGARIERRRGRTWVIDGVASLHGARHRIIGDRLEAASYAAAAIATRGDLFVHGAEPEHLHSFLATLRSVGGVCDVDAAGIRFRGPDRLGPATVETAPHPGFMTDWQPPLVVMLTQADGVSIVHETVYERRLGYVGALGEMGAAVDLRSECLGSAACRFRDRGCIHSAVISGPTPLVAGELEVPDLRAGFAYLLAALVAEGESTLTDVGNIERGYQAVLAKIRSLGGQIEDGFLGLPTAQRATA
jgi:UDP-N-acetylglucosamine 1-carboxyvinyltransferase